MKELEYKIKRWSDLELEIRKILESLPNGQGDECDCRDGTESYLVFVNDNDDESTVRYCTKCGGWVEF